MSANPEVETIQITKDNLEKLKFNAEGLIPAIAQDCKNGEVLMMAWMNIDSLRDTLKSGKASYWSRSRKSYWVKGETSGHFQYVKEIYYDCDCDVLLMKVDQVGSACHTMKRSCFYRKIEK
ncbi:MAG: phosphoribosyl-AMP cyclohydrolase [Candidatus Omnitrophica bacterium]|nr:phosphoribosyl-AMP cyclohydrolase [Candidatus Omnitrophota bacterium]MDE2223012.1 phosphoribosyl-AMP cyclohydrolase [Candidatus Omnitrophota bacterium]